MLCKGAVGSEPVGMPGDEFVPDLVDNIVQ